MMRWIVETSLKLRNLVIVGAALLIAFGVTQFRGTPVDVYPEFAPPRVEVQVLCLGMSAADVEALVTVPMEEALNGLPGLDVMRSRSVEDLSDIVLYFKPGTNLWEARLLTQERVRTATTQLPVWATSPYMVQPLSSTSRVMKIGLSTKAQDPQTLIDTALTAYWVVRPRLMRVPGVANAAIWGDRWSVLQVHTDPELLRKHDATLLNVLETSSEAVDVGMLKFTSGFEIGTGGFLDTPNQRLGIRHILPTLTPEEMAQIPLDMPKGAKPVALGEVATIVRDTQPHMNGDAVINDRIGVMMIIEKLPWGNTLEVTRGVEAVLEQLKPGLPGIEIDTTIFRPATFIEEALENLGYAMLIGFVLIAVVVMLFLYEWRVALISIVSIPLSLVAAGLVLKATGESINTMVLAGLVIALGVIVDDAIIDVENIVRRIRQQRLEGGTRSAAAIIVEASLEVRAPIVHATLIILASTAPIFFLEGLARSFFRPLGFAYATAILASMVVALTVTPALALAMLSKAPLERRASPLTRWLQARYVALLARIVPHPGGAYATVGVTVALGLAVLPFLGQALLPAFRERDFLMHWLARPGTSHEEMLRIVKQASKELRAIPGVRNFGAHIGQGTFADEPVGMNFAENWISIDRSADYDKTLAAINEAVDGYPGLLRDVQTYLKERTKEVLTGAGHAIVVRISGDDLDVLRQKAEEVNDSVADIDNIGRHYVELVTQIPQIQVEVDLPVASRYGIKPGDVRRSVSAFIASEEAGDIWRDGKNVEVHVYSVPKSRHNIGAVRDLMVEAWNGERVRLGDVAKVEMRPVANTVLRENSSRRIDVHIDVETGDLGAVAREVEKRLSKVSFARGYHAEVLGEFRERQTAERQLRIASIAAVLAILVILHTAFGSWRLTAIVGLTLPFALVGGILATGLGDRIVSLGTLVGLLTVLGIAARNGILMIKHFTHLERYEGETFGPALVLRGAQERLSPILMTSLAAGLGVVPLVVAGAIPETRSSTRWRWSSSAVSSLQRCSTCSSSRRSTCGSRAPGGPARGRSGRRRERRRSARRERAKGR